VLYDLSRAIGSGPWIAVDVAANGHYRGYLAKLRDDFSRSHVAGVDDEVRALQCPKGFFAQQPMSIRDNADVEGAHCHVERLLQRRRFPGTRVLRWGTKAPPKLRLNGAPAIRKLKIEDFRFQIEIAEDRGCGSPAELVS
jgi:hypothetical protein